MKIRANIPYTFEVIKIELLNNTLLNSSNFGSQRTNFIYDKGFSIDTANILQNIEKSHLSYYLIFFLYE
jgi:hypothetical protein